MKITPRKKQLLEFVNSYGQRHGFSPSITEIAKRFNLAISTVHQHLAELETGGYLKKEKNQSRSIDVVGRETMIRIPLLGTIAAGQPIEAIEVPDETIAITKDEIGKQGKHYALRVQGNSMIGDGIFDGDIVVVRSQQTADNGQTVVAIIDDNEATLKKLFREKGKIRLQPANKNLQPFYRKKVEIRGVVEKIIRNL